MELARTTSYGEEADSEESLLACDIIVFGLFALNSSRIFNRREYSPVENAPILCRVRVAGRCASFGTSCSILGGAVGDVSTAVSSREAGRFD